MTKTEYKNLVKKEFPHLAKGSKHLNIPSWLNEVALFYFINGFREDLLSIETRKQIVLLKHKGCHQLEDDKCN